MAFGFDELGSYGQRPWWVGVLLMAPFLLIIVIAVARSWMKRGFQGTNRPEGKTLSDRETETRRRFNARGWTATGNPIDYEADEKPPRY